MENHILLEFIEEQLLKPYPAFTVYPRKSIDSLKRWLALGILADKPAGNLVAVNGFTKTGKSTLAQTVLPSLIKMSLIQKPVVFKIAFVSFEIPKHKGNAFAIAHGFLAELHSKSQEIGLQIVFPVCNHIDTVSSAIKSLMHNLHTFVRKHGIRLLFVWDEIQRFFQGEDCHYETMVELFKFLCVSDTARKWTNFFFVFTGSGMSMAWRAFKS